MRLGCHELAVNKGSIEMVHKVTRTALAANKKAVEDIQALARECQMCDSTLGAHQDWHCIRHWRISNVSFQYQWRNAHCVEEYVHAVGADGI